MNVLEIKDLSKGFYIHEMNKQISSCQSISLSLKQGEFIGIVGRSGAGKSTILKCINRTYLPQNGSIVFNSKMYGTIDLYKATERQMIAIRRYEMGYVTQFLSVMPRTTAKNHVMNALLETGTDIKTAQEKSEEMLTYFKLPTELWDLYPHTFSGGERLRLNLAHAMIKTPHLLLLDEPTASLDDNTKVLVKEMLIKLKEQKTSMIGIFHDLAFMDGLCDQTFNISQGAFV